MIRPEKAFEFPILAEKAVSFSDKPCDSDSRTMKIRVKVVCSFLTLSKKPPIFQILAKRLKETAIPDKDNILAMLSLNSSLVVFQWGVCITACVIALSS